MAAPNAAEVGLLSNFRKRFSGGELNENQSADTFLVKWIRARNHNLDKAEQMLRKNLQWRQENDIDSITSWEAPKELKAMMPIAILGYDDDNCPVVLINFGQFNLRKIVKNGLQEAASKYFDSTWEQLHEKMKGKKQRDGTPVSQFAYIQDMEGFQLKNFTHRGVVDFMLQVARSFEANQPETLKCLYAVNAGRVFPIMLAILKPILAPATVAKINMFNSPSKWKPILRQKIPEDILPVAYGGTNTSVDLQTDADVDDADDSEVYLIPITIQRGDKVTVIFEVEEKNSTITWAFKTSKKGINFTVHSADQSKVYFESVKVDSHQKLVEGSITCTTAGEYVFTFDNSNNTDKDDTQELEYRIDIRSPSGTKQLAFD